MYRYDDIDRTLVQERTAQFRDQVGDGAGAGLDALPWQADALAHPGEIKHVDHALSSSRRNGSALLK